MLSSRIPRLTPYQHQHHTTKNNHYHNKDKKMSPLPVRKRRASGEAPAPPAKREPKTDPKPESGTQPAEEMPTQSMSKQQTPGSDDRISETSEKDATPPAGSTPEPSLPIVDPVQEDDVETSNVSGVPGGNTKTQPPSNEVRWTIPGMRPGTMHSIRKVILPERHFVSREGNAAMRYPQGHIAHHTLQAKKSKWLAEVCKEMT
ncbi:hypothetical protein FPRO06_09862 [Fusarium proliferatum]|nr:hypothetical protein FPRO06_09862 [Fusarium proliferatum]